MKSSPRGAVHDGEMLATGWPGRPSCKRFLYAKKGGTRKSMRYLQWSETGGWVAVQGAPGKVLLTKASLPRERSRESCPLGPGRAVLSVRGGQLRVQNCWRSRLVLLIHRVGGRRKACADGIYGHGKERIQGSMAQE